MSSMTYLYYANVYIGDSQTMATEASVLGTPAIRSNSFAEGSDMSNFRELSRGTTSSSRHRTKSKRPNRPFGGSGTPLEI